MSGHPCPRLLYVHQFGVSYLRAVGIGGDSGGQCGAQHASKRGEPPGQSGGQQIRDIGQASGVYGAEQFVGASEQGLAVSAASRICEHVGHHGRRLGSPGTQRGTGRDTAAEPGFEPDQRLPRQLPGSPAVLPGGQQPRHQAEGDGVAHVAGPEQVAQRLAGRPGAARGPVENGVGEGVPGQRAEIRDPGDEIGADRPGQDAGRVDDGIGQAEVRGGHGAERMVAGQDAGRSRRPACRWRGRQEPGGDLTITGRRDQCRVDAGGGETVPHGVPRIGGAQPVPEQVAEHTGTEVFFRAVGQHHQPLVPAPPGQRLTHGERRHTRNDPHGHVLVPEFLRPGPLRTRPDTQDAGTVILGSAPVPGAPAAREEWPGSRFRSLLHPPLHHHTLVRGLPPGILAAVRAHRWPVLPGPVSPGQPDGETGSRRWTSSGRSTAGGSSTGFGWPACQPFEDGVVGLRQGRFEPGRELVRGERRTQVPQDACRRAASLIGRGLGLAQRREPIPPERMQRAGYRCGLMQRAGHGRLGRGHGGPG